MCCGLASGTELTNNKRYCSTSSTVRVVLARYNDDMNELLIFVGTLVVFFLLLVLVELVHAHGKLEEYVSRKLAHAGAGLLFLLLPLWFDAPSIAIIALAFTLGLYFSHRSGKFSIHRRDRESMGEYYYPLSLGLAAALLLPTGDVRAYSFAVVVLAFGDGLAELVGRGWGKHTIRFVHAHKTWEGSVALFLTSLVAFLFLIPIISIGTIVVGLLVSVALTYAEMELGRGLDNLILPLLAGGLFLLAVLV